MGHMADHVGVVVVGCKVLPMFNENGIVDGAMKKIAHRIDGRKAVARVKELLRWATHGSSTVSPKKWKKVASCQQARDGPGTQCDDMSSGPGKLSFKWDAGSCSSAASSVLYSPLSSSASAKTKAATEHTPSRNYMSRLSSVSQKSSSALEPIASLLYSSPALRQKEDEEEACRMGQWITTDSDFVVLEL